MKTKLIPIAVAVLISGITIGAVGAQYQKYTQQQAHEERLSAIEQAGKDAQFLTELNGLRAHIHYLQTECQKGVTAHGLLPQLTRNKTPLPSCGDVSSN